MNNTLPAFPKFRYLVIEDKKTIDQFLNSLPPYSDFIFSSLWSWNTNPQIKISTLNNNLVLQMPDYISNKSFLTFLGSNKIEHTIETLLDYCNKQNLEAVLRLLPEHNFKNHDLSKLHPKYELKEDRDNFDYLLSIEKISTMQGLYSKKNKVTQFQKSYKYKVLIEDLNKKSVQSKIIKFARSWFKNHHKRRVVNENELVAIEKILKHSRKLNPKVICVYVDNKLIGFSIFELINKDYAHHGFQKANRDYKGIYEFIYMEMAKYLKGLGASHLNIEQDLGLEGLREAKLGYQPTFLKKYTISHK
ncbi:MAG: phosphatidylglycerol lysyltransferase domain-containing protein [Patescibacteria group bacterium]